MVHRSHQAQFLAAGLAALAACSAGGDTSNAAPRYSSIPQQSTAGGTAFTIDVGDYVTDREGATLTYAVSSGGGAFAGSSYSNTFESMGTHTIVFTVTDGAKTTEGTFEVKVTSANFAVVKEDDSGLFLLDTATNSQLRIAAATLSPTGFEGLADGRLVYQLGSPSRLWIYDPMGRTATRLAGDASGAAVFQAKTSDSRIVYTTGTSVDQTIWFYNPRTGVTHQIDDGGLATTTVLVNDANLVYYEAGVGGQADVFYYDPEQNESVTIGDAATDEQLQAVLQNGAAVFSRVGTGGEAHLFYFRVGTGLVEIGHDVSGLDTRNKTYLAGDTSSRVVFSAANGTDNELFTWNPANGQTTAIATGSDFVFDALGGGNEVVYHRVVSSTEHDAFFYDLDDATGDTVRDAADVTAVLAVVDGGSKRWALVQGSGATSTVSAVPLEASPSAVDFTSAGALEFGGTLANGDAVVQRTDGTALCLFDSSAGAWDAPITGTGLAFAGDGLDAGDFVYSLTASSQTDLSMWDASGTASVVVSNTAGDDTFGAKTDDGTILFTRVVGTNTTADLFVWDGATATRLTTADGAAIKHDHTVLGTYSGTR